MKSIVLPSPAKLNLFLAITGRRPDGFHELLSVAAPLSFGDTLTIESTEEEGFRLTCDDPALPVDETNLVLRAARAFATTTGGKGGAVFHLAKRIPLGAGLGGGSSNAAMALRGLNDLAGRPLNGGQLEMLASRIGSDCALFLRDGPVTMRGRGERLEALAPSALSRLRGRRVLIFKPSFSIATAWAYGQLVAAGRGAYLPQVEAEARLKRWIEDGSAPVEALLFNTMETVAFAKYLALPTLLADLERSYSLQARMSGSGSACFALLPAKGPKAEELAAFIRQAWGPETFVTAAEIV